MLEQCVHTCMKIIATASDVQCINCYEYKFCSNCNVFLLREKVIFVDVLFNLCIITQSTKQKCLVRCGYLFFVIFS